MPNPIAEVYDNYKHMGFILENPTFAADFKTTMLHNFWVAISAEAHRPKLDLDATDLLDTAVMYEQEAAESPLETQRRVFMAHAERFRAAADLISGKEPSAQQCCCCDRKFLAGSLNGLCDDCYEDKIA